VTSFEIPLTLRVVNWVRRRNGVALGALVLAVAAAITLSACGGGGSSNESGDASTTAAGQAGATGTTGATSAGPTGPTGATTKGSKRGRGKRKSQSGGSSSGGSKGSGGNTAGGKTTGTGSAPAQFGTLEEKELYREAKIVCGALTMPGLAHEYEVKSTPESVARAYAKGYAPNIRGAVYLGCKAAFTKK
jgi:hypothetical protein